MYSEPCLHAFEIKFSQRLPYFFSRNLHHSNRGTVPSLLICENYDTLSGHEANISDLESGVQLTCKWHLDTGFFTCYVYSSSSEHNDAQIDSDMSGNKSGVCSGRILRLFSHYLQIFMCFSISI